jgi:hypothetical protein
MAAMITTTMMVVAAAAIPLVIALAMMLVAMLAAALAAREARRSPYSTGLANHPNLRRSWALWGGFPPPRPRRTPSRVAHHGRPRSIAYPYAARRSPDSPLPQQPRQHYARHCSRHCSQ